MNRGQIAVSLLDEEDRRYRCVVTLGDGEVELFTEMAADIRRLPGEGEPLFAPAGERQERVLGADGELIGWLAYPAPSVEAP